MKDFCFYCVITLLFVLISSFNIFLFINIDKERYYCPDDNISMLCDRLSNTERTCYPNHSNNREKNYCESEWVLTSEVRDKN